MNPSNFKQLLARLDRAISSATIDAVYVDGAVAPLNRFMADYFSIESEIVGPHLYEYRDKDAISHLFHMEVTTPQS